MGSTIFYSNTTAAPLDLDVALSLKTNDQQWSDVDNDLLYYLTDDGLFAFHQAGGQTEKLIADTNLTDYIIKNNLIYLISNRGNTTLLKIWDANKLGYISQINIPSSTYKFINPANNFLNLYNPNNHILYLIDPLSELKPMKEIVNDINEATWIADSRLLCANDFEIWLLDMNNLNRQLLTRISDKITKVIWHPSNNYVIYSTDKSISVIELDDREKHNITKLIELDLIRDVYLNTAGDTLYFNGEIGNQKGFYKLAIQ